MEYTYHKILLVFFGRPETRILGWGKQKYPFMVANTDPVRKPGIHWWSFLDKDEKDTLFFFDSFGSYSLFNFVVTNDLEVFNKVIPGQFGQTFKQDNKITLLKWSFKLKNYEKLRQKELNKLSSTAKYFFKFLFEFGKHKKVKNTVKVVTVDNNLQSCDTEVQWPEVNPKESMWSWYGNCSTRYSTSILDRTKGYWTLPYCSTKSSLMERMFSLVTMKWKKLKSCSPSHLL